MKRLLPNLSPRSLETLAGALSAERIPLPVTRASLASYLPADLREDATDELVDLLADGSVTDAREGALVLRLLAAERRETQQVRDRVELVWSGPEAMGATASRTDQVIRRLFAEATSSVLLSSYNLDHKPERSQELFTPLALQMEKNPALKVRLFLNIKRDLRKDRDTPEEVLVGRFARSFRDEHWPGKRLPEVYHDPRAMASRYARHRPVLHAKCVIIDDRKALVTSANFSESAHHRNIEAGTLVEDARFAHRLREQFEMLVRRRKLLAVPGLGSNPN